MRVWLLHMACPLVNIGVTNRAYPAQHSIGVTNSSLTLGQIRQRETEAAMQAMRDKQAGGLSAAQ